MAGCFFGNRISCSWTHHRLQSRVPRPQTGRGTLRGARRYAAHGDLHSYVVGNGPVEEKSAQFTSGEILAALLSLHEAGFLFGDLKPENVVLTSSGHAKLTDFGGCRAFTAESQEKLAESKHALRDLRDGDWANKSAPACVVPASTNVQEEEEDENAWEEDDRVEATLAYCPPEVVSGGRPSAFADSWSFGCVLHFLLTGRPPIVGEDDESVKERVVKFNVAEAPADAGFSKLSASAQRLIAGLLKAAPDERTALNDAERNEFYAGVDVHTLYSKEAPAYMPPADKVDADDVWAKRQYSKLWSAIPANYNLPRTGKVVAEEGMTTIAEGPERDAPFTYQ